MLIFELSESQAWGIYRERLLRILVISYHKVEMIGDRGTSTCTRYERKSESRMKVDYEK